MQISIIERLSIIELRHVLLTTPCNNIRVWSLFFDEIKLNISKHFHCSIVLRLSTENTGKHSDSCIPSTTLNRIGFHVHSDCCENVARCCILKLIRFTEKDTLVNHVSYSAGYCKLSKENFLPWKRKWISNGFVAVIYFLIRKEENVPSFTSIITVTPIQCSHVNEKICLNTYEYSVSFFHRYW